MSALLSYSYCPYDENDAIKHSDIFIYTLHEVGELLCKLNLGSKQTKLSFLSASLNSNLMEQEVNQPMHNTQVE